MDVNCIWNDFLNIIKNQISPISLNLWFKYSKLYKLENNQATILITSDNINKERFVQSLIKNYSTIIKEILDSLTESDNELIFITEEPIDEKNNTIEFEENKNNITNEETLDNFDNYKYYNYFNPKYTFDTFVVGDSNKLAYNSALTVAKKPGKLYNPFFIYGKSGLGKTHLMHAIGNYITNNSNLKVLYITSEQFLNDYVSMNKDKKKNNASYYEAFRKKYRNVDVLMIDDIQFLKSAPGTQIEFTNTFNSLYDNDKQIIISSDTSVKDLEYLEDRLKTRFLGGLTECIYPPDYHLKKEIITNKIKLYNYPIEINNEIIDYMANNCGNDVRNLEGALTRLIAYSATFSKKDLTLKEAKDALIEYTSNPSQYRELSNVKKIISEVAKYYNLDEDLIIGKLRKKNIVLARSVAMYLSRIHTFETVERIGALFGGKNHSTVIHGANKIMEEIKTNKKLENDIKILTERIF